MQYMEKVARSYSGGLSAYKGSLVDVIVGAFAGWYTLNRAKRGQQVYATRKAYMDPNATAKDKAFAAICDCEEFY